MDDLFKYVGVAALMVMGYWYQSTHGGGMHPNAPEGAIEYFESEDGDKYLMLFEDELVWGDDSPTGDGETSFPLEDITSVKKLGMNLKVVRRDGTYLDLTLVNPLVAGRFRDKIEDLQQQL